MILILGKIIVHPQLALLTSNNDSLIFLFVAYTKLATMVYVYQILLKGRLHTTAVSVVDVCSLLYLGFFLRDMEG